MCRECLSDIHLPGWFAEGTVLRVSWDSEAGSLSAFSRNAAPDASDGAPVVHKRVLPGAKVGVGLFPVVSGNGGARIRWRSAGGPLSALTSGLQVRAAADALCSFMQRRWQAAVIDKNLPRYTMSPYGASRRRGQSSDEGGLTWVGPCGQGAGDLAKLLHKLVRAIPMIPRVCDESQESPSS